MKLRPVTSLQNRSTVRRREILDAALACFDVKGVEGIAIEDICGRSGASVSSVYHLFGSKAGVAVALYLDSLCAFQESVGKALHSEMGAREGLQAVVAAHLQWAEQNPVRAKYLQAARHTESVVAHAQEIHVLNREFFLTMEQWIRAQLASAKLRSLPTDLFMAQWLGPTHEYIRGRLGGRESTSLQVAMDQLGGAAWRALGNEEAAANHTHA